MEVADTCPLSAQRGQAEVLWSLTATYVATLAAYGHLIYSLQGQKNVSRVLYQLLMFIMFPLYPLLSLAISTIQASREWRWRGRKNTIYCLSLVSGLHTSRAKGSSEPLSFRHLWQGSFVCKDESKTIRAGRGLVLAFASSQCLGTLVKAASRLHGQRDLFWFFLFERFPPADFEAFWMSIGAIGILIKSWMAIFLNTEWKSNYEVIETVDETLVSEPAAVAVSAALFYRPQTRTALLFVLLIGSAALVDGYLPLLVIAWNFLIPISLIWLIRSDAEALTNGLVIHMSGFFACLVSALPRRTFYVALSEPHLEYDRVFIVNGGGERYWVKGGIPRPLALSLLLGLERLDYLEIQGSKALARSRVWSHLYMVAVNVVIMIVLPAYVLSWTEVSMRWPVNRSCPPGVLKDPFWTPSF